MTWFNTKTGTLYEEDCQPGDREATADEIAQHQAVLQWSAYQATAQAALDACDLVALRCWKAGVVFPQEWKDYDKALRLIMGLSQPVTIPTILPAQPASYPAGT